MPYRLGEDSCAICQRVATAACWRCGNALCADHAHGPDRRCERCEGWYEEHQRLGRNSSYPLEIPSRAARVILCFTPLWPVGMAAILKEAASKRRRRRFLRERPDRVQAVPPR